MARRTAQGGLSRGQRKTPQRSGRASSTAPAAGRPLRALVAVGPTHEPIDEVRYLGNRSSGRMGMAIAESLAAEGCTVTVLAGPGVLPTGGLATERFVTTADLGRLLGGGAHLRDLRRTSVGAFSITEAASIDDAPLRPTEEAVRALSQYRVSGTEAESLLVAASTGKVLPVSTFSGPEPWAAFADDRLAAVYESFSNERVGTGMARPAVSLAGATTS